MISLCATAKLDSPFSISKDISTITILTRQSLSITGGNLLVSQEFAERARPAIGCRRGGRQDLDRRRDATDRDRPALLMASCNRRYASITSSQQLAPNRARMSSLETCPKRGSNMEQCWQLRLAWRRAQIPVTKAPRTWIGLPYQTTIIPLIPQNIYRMSGGANNNERFEQIGQSWMKHAFAAASSNTCGFGCNGVGGDHLGSGCSDPYSSGLNGEPSRHRFARLGKSIHRDLPTG